MNTPRHWHNQLLQKYLHYRQWHQHPRHPFWHWVFFSFVAIFVFNHLYVRIGDYLNEEILSLSIQTPHAQAAGNTYYVSTSGNDANSCTAAQNISTPRRTINAGLGCLSGGDTLVINDSGTYSEGIDCSSQNCPAGSASVNTTIRGANSSTRPILNPPSRTFGIRFYDNSYITLQDVKIDANNVTSAPIISTGDIGSNHITIRNVEIYNISADDTGAITSNYGSGYLSYYNNYLHGFKTGNRSGGIYLNNSNSIAEGNTIDGPKWWGIQIYNGGISPRPSNNLVRNNLIKNCGLAHPGIGVYNGDNNTVYNNIVSGCAYGLYNNYGATNSKFYNNTIYGNVYASGFTADGSGEIKNNIFRDFAPSTSSGWTLSNNLMPGTDPQFISPSTGDFHLQSSSPAINTGATLSAVTTDFDGVSRPQGSAYDIGAYEYGGVVNTPTPTPTPTTIFTPTPAPTPPPSGTILLEDFSSVIRKNGDGSDLWAAYNGEDPGQTYSLSNGQFKIVGSSTNGVYWHFFPYPYSGTAGFTKGYIKSGIWDSNVNRLRFKATCTRDLAQSVWSSIQLGTYVKSNSDNVANNQGAHYYHHFSGAMYANKWSYFEVNRKPQHQVGASASTDWPENPTAPSFNYFDGLTRWYWDTQSAFTNATCYFDDFTFAKETDEPDNEISSIMGTYTGSKYDVSFAGLKNTNRNFNVRYSTQSMKVNGFASGTDGGVISTTGDDYTGVFWFSPNMTESLTGMYIAIQPQGQIRFTEFYIPNSGVVSTPTPIPTPPASGSSCDLNKDSQTNILDFQLLANVILGITPNPGGSDINKDGQTNILDTQVLANVILGKNACP